MFQFGQFIQKELLLFEYFPDKQLAQLEEYEVDTLPLVHEVQINDAGLEEYFPSIQISQVSANETLEYLPVSHGTHRLEPLLE
jgi:hypothetical protein